MKRIGKTIDVFNRRYRLTLSRHKYPLLALVVFTLVYYSLWYFSFSPIAQGDWRFYYPETLIDLFQSSLLWENMYGLGGFNTMFFLFPLWVLHAAFGFLGGSFGFVERALYMYLIPLLFVISPYVLFYSVSKSRLVAFFGSLFYAFNTYVLVLNVGGHLTVSWAVAFFPLGLTAFMVFLRRPSYMRGVFMALLLAMMAMYEVRIAYLGIVLLGVYALVVFFVRRWTLTRRVVLASVVGIVAYLFLAAYWVFPLMYSLFFGSGLSGLLESNVLFHPYISFAHSLTLFHPFWSLQGMQIFEELPVPALAFFLPLSIIGCFALLWNRVAVRRGLKAEFIFFSVVMVFGVLLAKQDNPPWSGLYVWLFDHFPGFSMFRESSKFYFFVMLSYAFFLGHILEMLWNDVIRRSTSRMLHRVGAAIFFALILSSFAYIIIPRFSSGANMGLLVPHEPSAAYLELADTLRADDAFGRVLWNPRQSMFGYVSALHPGVSVERMLATTWGSEQCIDGSESVCYLRSESDPAFHFARNAGLKYAVVPETVFEGDGAYNEDEAPSGPTQWLGRIPNLVFVRKFGQDMSLFRFNYPEGDPGVIEGRRLAGDSVFRVYNKETFPNTFHVILNDEFYRSPSRIFLSYTYDDGWRLYERDVARVGTPLGFWESLDVRQPSSDFEHVIAGKYYNGWDFRHDAADANTRPREYILRYQPMNWLFVGLGISSLSFLALAVFGIVVCARAYGRRRGEEEPGNNAQKDDSISHHS